MIGAIIGDIAGSRFEFNNVKRSWFKLFADECSFTDDTICTVAIADAIMCGKPYADSLREWCRKYPHPMGGYGASFAGWVFNDNAQPYNSFGNGSAMRVSPVAWLFDKGADVEKEAAKTASVTHNHPEGIKGAQVIANCIYALRKGCSKQEILRYARSEYGNIPAYRPYSNSFDETCMNAVPVAIGCFIDSTGFEDAIRKAILVGGDSDTIGAIVGSLAEAHYNIPEDLFYGAFDYLPDDMAEVVQRFYLRQFSK